MMNRGKAALAMMSRMPNLNVKVMPPETAGDSNTIIGPSGKGMPALRPRPGYEAYQGLADRLNALLSGGLAALYPGVPMRESGDGHADRSKRKREIMADVLDGKSK